MRPVNNALVISIAGIY